ncbi:MAG TPA: ABC transporter substrate-binding protein, partial [Chloroflexota bacterium]|nr:ABC transporter substrate-binding protein [Chloroflexota bacterium]
MIRPSSRTLRRHALALSLLAVTALTPFSAQHAARAAAPSTLTIGIAAEPDTLDPQKAGSAIEDVVGRIFGDGLVALSPAGKIVPALAKSWTVSKDGLLYGFTLRQDVTFQDGTPLDAAAYVATLQRLINPATKAAIQASRLGSIAAITQTGKYSFTIKLKAPYPFLLFQLSDSGHFSPLSPTALKAEGAGFGRKPVSTGPWQVQQWVTGSQIVLTRNANYRWGPSFVHAGPPSIAKIVFRIVTNDAAQTAALQSGELDVLTVPSESVPRIQASGQYTILKSLALQSTFLEFNVTKAPFTDVRVRRALNYAVNKQEVLQIGLGGLGQPIYGVVQSNMFNYWSGVKSYAYPYNPQKAQALLTQAGWTMKNGVEQKNGHPLSFTTVVYNPDSFKRSAEDVQAQLKKIGVTMNIQLLDLNGEIAAVRKGNEQASLFAYAGYPLPDIFYIWFHSSQIGTGFDDSRIDDPTLDALIVKMKTTIDDTARTALVGQLERYVIDKALWVPLWDPQSYIALQPRVKGV